jgi:hypothetical protein
MMGENFRRNRPGLSAAKNDMVTGALWSDFDNDGKN